MTTCRAVGLRVTAIGRAVGLRVTAIGHVKGRD